jgi:hypothetical protein
VGKDKSAKVVIIPSPPARLDKNVKKYFFFTFWCGVKKMMRNPDIQNNLKCIEQQITQQK